MLISSANNGAIKMTAKTTTNKFYQLVDIKDFRSEANCSDIGYADLASDCNAKTISLLDAINYISLNIFSLTEDDETDKEKISNLSIIISSLAELAIATNKISQTAAYLSSVKDGNHGA